jgi:hypothetical protein
MAASIGARLGDEYLLTACTSLSGQWRPRGGVIRSGPADHAGGDVVFVVRRLNRMILEPR